jgi:hypothetical protein
MTALARHRDRAAEGGFQPQALTEETVKHGAGGIDLTQRWHRKRDLNIQYGWDRILVSLA